MTSDIDTRHPDKSAQAVALIDALDLTLIPQEGKKRAAVLDQKIQAIKNGDNNLAEHAVLMEHLSSMLLRKCADFSNEHRVMPFAEIGMKAMTEYRKTIQAIAEIERMKAEREERANRRRNAIIENGL